MRNIFRSMMKWPTYLLLYVLLMTGAYFALAKWLPEQALWAVAVLAFGVLLFVLIWRVRVQNRILGSVMDLSISLNQDLQGKMDALAYPYAVVNEEGRLIWQNAAFRKVVAENGSEDIRGSVWLKEIFPDTEKWEQPGTDQETPAEAEHYLSLGDRVFGVSMRRIEGSMQAATILMSDETEHLQTLVELEDSRNVSGLVYVDNYEELLKNTEAEKQSLLNAVIEQRINRYFQNYNGLVCKTERDHFFVTLDAKGLRGCKSERFGLLKDVKSIRIGNSAEVTLSMAFGYDGESYENNLEMARAAMDLALARGGDQAVLKSPDGVEYFGGKALGEAAQTRVKARVKAQALRELIATKDEVFIMGHRLGDNDSFGAAIAVYRMAVSMQKRAYVVLNQLSFSVRPFWERFQTDPGYPREMFLNSEEAAERMGDDALLVVVDTNRASMTECPELLERTDQVVVFDHHRQMSDAIPAILAYVEPYASSASEMVAEIMQYFGEELKPKPLEADAIYSGILVDTNNFSDRTSARTFEAAAYLKRGGADLVLVKKLLRENYAEYQAKADTTRRAEMFMDAYAFSECMAEGLDSPTIVGAQAANELLNIAGVKASFVFTRVGETVFVSARSIDEVNVQLICERMGGGGHLSVAGVQLKGCTVPEAMDRVKETIKIMTEEGALE